MPHRRPAHRWIVLSGMLAALMLSACGGAPRATEASPNAGSGITVYGTVDAGVSRTAR